MMDVGPFGGPLTIQGSTRYRYRYRYRRYLQLSYHIDSDIILLFFDIFINWMIINMSNHSHSTAITNFHPIEIFGALSDTIFFKVACLKLGTYKMSECLYYPVTKRDHRGGSQLKISYRYHIDIDDMG